MHAVFVLGSAASCFRCCCEVVDVMCDLLLLCVYLLCVAVSSMVYAEALLLLGPSVCIRRRAPPFHEETPPQRAPQETYARGVAKKAILSGAPAHATYGTQLHLLLPVTPGPPSSCRPRTSSRSGRWASRRYAQGDKEIVLWGCGDTIRPLRRRLRMRPGASGRLLRRRRPTSHGRGDRRPRARRADRKETRLCGRDPLDTSQPSGQPRR